MPDVARFHVFAHCLAVFRRCRCNTGQSLCPLHVKRRLPVFVRRRTFPRFCPSLSHFSGVSVVTRGNIRVPVMISEACPFSPDVARFHVFALRLAVLGVSAVTRGNVCVPFTLRDAFLFSPDVAHFHVFALRLAVFRRFCCNTGQRTCARHVKRCLPVFSRHCPSPRFRPSLSHFQAFPL
jgi:hypothetical protein